LLALVKKFAPKVCVETGGNLGMSSSFILQGMCDAGVQGGKLKKRTRILEKQNWLQRCPRPHMDDFAMAGVLYLRKKGDNLRSS
jgi:hypothetical protein